MEKKKDPKEELEYCMLYVIGSDVPEEAITKMFSKFESFLELGSQVDKAYFIRLMQSLPDNTLVPEKLMRNLCMNQFKNPLNETSFAVISTMGLLFALNPN